MNQEHLRYWVSDQTGLGFEFGDRCEISGDIPAERLTNRLASGDTPGEDGEYQEAYSTLDARTVMLKGLIISEDLLAMQTALDDVTRAFPRGASGKLYRCIIDLDDSGKVLSARYLPCRVAYFEKGSANGLPNSGWEIGFRAAKPLYLEDDHFEEGVLVTVPRILALVRTDGGVTNITCGGVGPVRPVITLVVSTPGTITLTPGGVGASRRSLVLNASTIGTYILDMETRPSTVTKAGLSVLGDVTGDFITLPPSASTITVGLSGGAVLAVGSQIAWRRTFPFTV